MLNGKLLELIVIICSWCDAEPVVLNTIAIITGCVENGFTCSQDMRILTMNFGPLFRGAQIFTARRYAKCSICRRRVSDCLSHKFSITEFSDICCHIVTKFCTVRGLANGNLFPEFGELWLCGPVLPCGDMHQSH